MRIRTSLLTAVAMLSLSATAAMSDGLTLLPAHTLTMKPDVTEPKPADKPVVMTPEVVKPGVMVGDLVLPTADLIITSVDYNDVNLLVEIKNQGAAASTPTNLKLLRWQNNQATSTGTPVAGLAPGESTVVMADVGGNYYRADHIYVRVDDPNLVKETSDGNNSYKVK